MAAEQLSRIDPVSFESADFMAGEVAMEPTVDAAVERALLKLSRRRPLTDPFRHIVADGLFDDALLSEAAEQFPPDNSTLWFQCGSPLEKKFYCNRVDLLEPVVSALVRRLNRLDVARVVGKVMGIRGLVVDPSLHGAGLHMMEPGGKRDVHLDVTEHPRLPLRRRVNLVLYLNDYWQDAWGGALELWDPTLTRSFVRISPNFNRLVLFEVHDRAYHGHPHPLASASGCSSSSIALSFHTARNSAPTGQDPFQ